MPKQYEFLFISEEEKIEKANKEFPKTKGKPEPKEFVLERIEKKKREKEAFEKFEKFGEGSLGFLFVKMADKKIIMMAVVLAIVLVIAGWIWSRQTTQDNSEDNQITKTAGIVIGNENAAVTIEGYTNFLCSACGFFVQDTWPQMTQNYIKTGKVKFIFYIFPPLELAKAAFCAQDQDNFLAYHDYLFSHQEEIKNEEQIFEFAKNVGLDSEKFNQCYLSDEAKNAADGWLKDGQKREVMQTPTFFINGEKLVGAQPYAEFQKIIDSKLK